jgi:hypothetical protein
VGLDLLELEFFPAPWVLLHRRDCPLWISPCRVSRQPRFFAAVGGPSWASSPIRSASTIPNRVFFLLSLFFWCGWYWCLLQLGCSCWRCSWVLAFVIGGILVLPLDLYCWCYCCHLAFGVCLLVVFRLLLWLWLLVVC